MTTAMAAVLLIAAGIAHAGVEFEHRGDADPQANGWSRSSSAANVSYGGVANDLTASQCPYPCAYRYVSDLGTGSGNLGNYYRSVNDAQIGHPGGWAVRFRVKRPPVTPGVAEVPNFSATLLLRYTPQANVTQEYSALLGVTADNRMVMQPVNTPAIELGPANAYHLIEFVSNPALGRVDVVADGALVLSDFAGRVLNNHNADLLSFGSAASAATGISRWNLVQFVTAPDTDGDGANDVDEVATHGTDPYDTDSDDDGLGDGFELLYGFDPLIPGEETLDGDADGLDNLGEFDAGSDPTDSDSDDDGLSDGDEIQVHGSSPVETDTDGDGLDDFMEVTALGTDPARSDTDADALDDDEEIDNYGTDPTNDDSDSDGLADGQEILKFETDPLDADTDGDMLTDGFEAVNGFDPLLAGEQALDGDADGLDNLGEQAADSDPGDPDSDGDGLSDGDEVDDYLTSPIRADTDFDGLSDAFEVSNSGFDPLSPGEEYIDSDEDGLYSLAEQASGTDPNNADSDADGYSDGDEVRILKTDPNDPLDNGVPIVRKTDLALSVQGAQLFPDSQTTMSIPVMNETYGGTQGKIYRLDQQLPLETAQRLWDEGWAECKTARTGPTFRSCANYSITPSDSICRNGGTIDVESYSVSCCTVPVLGGINTAATWGSCGEDFFGNPYTGSFTLATVEGLISGDQIPDTITIPQGLGDRPTVAPPPVELDVGAVVTHNVSLTAAVNTTIDFADGGVTDLDYETVATLRSTRSTVAAGATFRLVASHVVKAAESSLATQWPAANVNVGLDMGLDASIDVRYASINPNPNDLDDLQLDVTTNVYDSSVSTASELFDLRLGPWQGLKMTILGDADWVPELYQDLEVRFDPPAPGIGITYEYTFPAACPSADTFGPCNLALKPPINFDLLGTRLQLPDLNTPVGDNFKGGAAGLYRSTPAEIHRNHVSREGWLINSAPGRYRPITNISPNNSLFDTFVGDQTSLGGDWFRFEVDLDGFATLASSGAFIAGANFQDPLGLIVLEWNVLDSDLVYWAGNDQALTFKPNLKADIVFSKTVTLHDRDVFGNPVAVVVNAGETYSLPVNAAGDAVSSIEVVQPDGGVDIDVSYSFRDNCFVNDSYDLGTFAWRNAVQQLKIQGILGGVLAANSLPTEFTAFKYTQQFGEPIQSENQGGSFMLGGEDTLTVGGAEISAPAVCESVPDVYTAQLDFPGSTLSVMDLTADGDADGLGNALEDTGCTSPVDADSDDDGLFDGIEDANANGLVDAGETSPCVADTDGDGLTDGQELGVTSPVADPDGDGPLLGSDIAVFLPSTNPDVITDPTLVDTDQDGLSDGQEVNQAGTDPRLADTDGDGIVDGVDALPLDPTESVDTDGDGIGNNADSDDDGDGMPDAYEIQYGLDPEDPGDAGEDLDGDGRSNLAEFQQGSDPTADDVPPVLTVPADIRVDSTGPYTPVALGVATAFDGKDGVLAAIPDNSGPFAPGNHVITWNVADAAGNKSSQWQQVQVVPMVNFNGVTRDAAEGQSLQVMLSLNGNAVEFPVIVPYTVSGTAESGVDYTALSGELRITELEALTLDTTIVADGAGDDGETIVLTLLQPTNAVAGPNREFTIVVREGNLAPRVALDVLQGSRRVSTMTRDGGLADVFARAEDPNGTGSFSYDWRGTDAAVLQASTQTGDQLTIDAAAIESGTYKVAVTVMDDGNPALSATQHRVLRVVATAPSLDPGADTDGDGIADADEGLSDNNDNGVSDYLDPGQDSHLLVAETGTRRLLQAPDGLDLRLGRVAMASGEDAVVTMADVIEFGADGAAALNADDSRFRYPGGIYDFEVSNVAQAAGSVRIVLPQTTPIPEVARYRKFRAAEGWQDFVSDAGNTLMSAPGEPGVCPAPGSPVYSAGLTAGHHCVQILIEDGGLNDADGAANGIISDPGGVAFEAVAVAATATRQPTANQTVSAGARNVVLMRFTIDVNSPDVEISAIDLDASGTGNDGTDITAVKVWIDTNSNGQVDSSDTYLGTADYPSNDAALHLPFDTPYIMPTGETKLLVSYDF